jgi:hypothetical protein
MTFASAAKMRIIAIGSIWSHSLQEIQIYFPFPFLRQIIQ